MALLLLTLSTAQAVTYLDSGSISGKSTYYGGNPSGNACGYTDVATGSFPFGYYAACGSTVFNDGYGCGKCYEITCIGPYSPNPSCSCSSTTPSVIISCMDQCSECTETHFDLDPTAMARIVGPGLSGTCGVIETRIRRVACDYTGNIKIRSKSGTNNYWYGLHIDDIAGYGSVESVKIKSSGSSSYNTQCLKSEGPSFWKCDGGYPLNAPLSVQLTDSNGETITCNGCIGNTNADTEWNFGSNFGIGPVTPTTSTTKVPTTTTTKSPTQTGATPSPTTTTTTTTSGGGGGATPIVIKNHHSSQDWYYSFQIDNIDASGCSDSIKAAKIWYAAQNRWDAAEHADDDATGSNGNGYRWGFDNFGFAFSQMLPISIRLEMTSGRNIDLMNVVTSITSGDEFVTTETLCDGTLAPTAPTVAPTAKSPTAPTTPYPTAATVCIDEDALQWRSYNNQIYLNGNRFNMKGLSWFGYETGNYGLYGLDKHSQDWYFQWMVDNGFNAMRLPFSGDFMFNGNTLSSNFNAYKATIQKAASYGIVVMPDMHSKTAGSWTDGLNTINKADVIAQWGALAEGLKNEWNVFVADIFNEPHDVENSQWGEWIEFCEDCADAIWSTGANWMVAVEGTNWQCDTINCAWGENLEGVRKAGITFDNNKHGENRFIWSPHVYGADVTGNSYSTAGWYAHWGYLVDGNHLNEAASVIGEFGTRYEGGMVNWLDDLINYLISIDQRNTFYWCLNPNSGDTGGLLADDWTTPMTAKLNALDKLQPNPSIIQYNSGAAQVCVAFEGGTVATPAPTTTATTTTTTTTTKAPTTTTTTTKVPTTQSPTTKAPTTKTPTTTTTTTKAPTTTTTILTPIPTTTTTLTPAPTTTTTVLTPVPTTTTTTTTLTPAPTTTTTTLTPAPTTTTTTTKTPTTTTTILTPAPTTTTTTKAPTTTTTILTPVPTTTTTTTTLTPAPTTTTTKTPTTTTTTTTTTKPPTTTTTTKAPTTTTTTTTTTRSPSTSGAGITIINWPDTQNWYLTFLLTNIDSCVDQIEYVQILQNGEWRNNDQHYYEQRADLRLYGHRYGWLYQHPVQFGDLLPISVRILFKNGESITLSNIIHDFISMNIFSTDKRCNNIDSGNTASSTSTSSTSSTSTTTSDIEIATTLKIENCDGAHNWWYAARLVDLADNVRINTFEMQDASGNNNWMIGRYDTGSGCFIWDGGVRPYQLPLNFRITGYILFDTTQETLETNENNGGQMDSYTAGYIANMAENFEADKVNEYNYNDSSNDGNNNGLKWFEIVIIVCCVIIIIAIIIGTIYWFKRRRRDNKNNVNRNGIAMITTNGDRDTPIVDEENSTEAANEQTNIVPVHDDDD